VHSFCVKMHQKSFGGLGPKPVGTFVAAIGGGVEEKEESGKRREWEGRPPKQ